MVRSRTVLPHPKHNQLSLSLSLSITKRKKDIDRRCSTNGSKKKRCSTKGRLLLHRHETQEEGRKLRIHKRRAKNKVRLSRLISMPTTHFSNSLLGLILVFSFSYDLCSIGDNNLLKESNYPNSKAKAFIFVLNRADYASNFCGL